MPPPNESDSNSNLPRYLRKDPMKQRQSVASRFNFSWIGGMAQQLRSALKRENRTEILNVRRQSEHAQRYRESELFARENKPLVDASAKDVEEDAKSPSTVDNMSNEARALDNASGESAQSGASPELHASENESEEEEDASANEVEVDAAELDADLDDDYDEEDLIVHPYKAHDDSQSPEMQGAIVESGPVVHAEDDAEDLDAEDLDEELDAEDLDAEDLDAEELDAEEMDVEAPNAEGSYAVVERDAVETYEQDEVSSDAEQLRNEDSFAPVDPSDHEAHEYDPELSSMSLWEGTGFQSYDSAMDVEYDRSEHEEEAPSDAESEQDVKREVRQPTTGAPFAHSLDSEPPVEHDRGTSELTDSLNKSSPPPTLAGSQLEPSRRFVGFHFGPAQTVGTKLTVNGQAADPKLSSSSSVVTSTAASTSAQTTTSEPEVESNTDNGVKSEDCAISNEEQHAKIGVNKHDLPQQNKSSSEESSEENPYAGLWNLFSVGFTVAPQTNPVKGARPLDRSSHEPSRKVAEPEVSIDEEFHLLAQAAHRVMAGSTLFGGMPATPVKPRASAEIASLPTASHEDHDPTVYNKRVSGIAHTLFSNSPLFGGKIEKPAASTSEMKPEKETEKNELKSDRAPSPDLTDESLSAPKEASSVAEELTNNEVEKKPIQKNEAEDGAKGAVKRRRLRKNMSKEEQGLEESAGSKELSIDSNALTDPKKRKRAERTRPLTRAALRAQKQKENENAADSEEEPENLSEPSKKKRRSAQKDAHKTGPARTTRRRA